MKTRQILSLAALAGLASLAGCFSEDSPSPTDPGVVQELQLKGSISGTVRDTLGAGVSGVAVTLDSGGFATNTDNAGRYTIPDVPGRTWTVRFTRAGWRDTSVAGIVLAIDEDRVGVDMVMRALPDTSDTTGSLSGVVTDSLGAPLAGVSVLVVSQGGLTISDVSGAFTLSGLPQGAWTLEFRHPAFRDTTLMGVALERREAKTGLAMALRPKPVFRTVTGTLRDSGAVKSVTLVVERSGQSPLLTPAVWNPVTGIFTGSVLVLPEATLLQVQVRDAEGNVVGARNLPLAARDTTSLQAGTFSARNALPIVEAGPDRLGLAGDSVWLSATGLDSLGSRPGVSGYNWSCGGQSFPGTVDGRQLWVLPGIGPVTCRVVVTDQDGNESADSLVVTVGRAQELVDVAAGSFTMGYGVPGAENAQLRTVHLSRLYAIGGTEVTWAQMVDRLKAERASLTADSSTTIAGEKPTDLYLGATQLAGFDDRHFDGRDWFASAADWNKPVTGLTWAGAAWFCNALSRRDGLVPVYSETDWSANLAASGYRLPTEAQWEYAARGGALSKGTLYAGGADAAAVAWYDGNAGDGVREVATKVPN
jgi:formylglycine-generating enzyme required for sulfatase activity